MKKLMYVLILPLVVVSGFVFANHESKNETAEKPGPKTKKAETPKFVFKSTDGGQTWQDISKGLPENLREEGIRGDSIFANEKGLFLRVGNGLYHNPPAAGFPSWTKEIFSVEQSSIAPGTSGIPANTYWGVNLKKTNGTSVWSPIFDHSLKPQIGSFFETADGILFLGTDKGLFKTADDGKTWKHVYAGGWTGHLAESGGVLVSTSKRRIIRSTDNGENWAPAISEDSVTWDVKPFNGGFAAITSTSESGTRRLSTSDDGGKTWLSVHSTLLDKVVIDSIGRTWDDRPLVRVFQTSIIQVGEAFLGAHREGIFRSSDKGKTWKLLLPSVDDKGFILFVSGNVMYAIRSRGGC